VPEVFLVDDDDRLQIRREQPPEALRARRGARHSASGAPLSIVDDWR
jgi:hypothetical protein